MKFSVRLQDEDSEIYTLIITSKDVTLNITMQGDDLSEQFKDLIQNVKLGIGGSVGGIHLQPVGNNVVMTIHSGDVTYQYISRLSDLKFQ